MWVTVSHSTLGFGASLHLPRVKLRGAYSTKKAMHGYHLNVPPHPWCGHMTTDVVEIGKNLMLDLIAASWN